MLIPKINFQKEITRIIDFIAKTLKEQGFEKIVLGVSGGVDSMTVYYLLKRVVPQNKIFAFHLYYFNPDKNILDPNINLLTIKKTVDEIIKNLKIDPKDKLRIGNIIARVRMIHLHDLAKKNNALVCGTENKSERQLGYFTRFGDAASDLEPMQHLYKTQVNELAKELCVPKLIIEQKPTAGLWIGQTDESEFGFSYLEADQVLYLYFDKKMSIEEILKLGFKNTKKIIAFAKKNQFKQNTPYRL